MQGIPVRAISAALGSDTERELSGLEKVHTHTSIAIPVRIRIEGPGGALQRT